MLWRTCGHPVETDLIERADVLPVLSVHMPVLTATDVVVTKLMALDEHYCDFARLLPVARALREQVDWAAVGRRWPATTSRSSSSSCSSGWACSPPTQAGGVREWRRPAGTGAVNLSASGRAAAVVRPACVPDLVASD